MVWGQTCPPRWMLGVKARAPAIPPYLPDKPKPGPVSLTCSQSWQPRLHRAADVGFSLQGPRRAASTALAGGSSGCTGGVGGRSTVQRSLQQEGSMAPGGVAEGWSHLGWGIPRQSASPAPARQHPSRFRSLKGGDVLPQDRGRLSLEVALPGDTGAGRPLQHLRRCHGWHRAVVSQLRSGLCTVSGVGLCPGC